jgi:hypothetical protein
MKPTGIAPSRTHESWVMASSATNQEHKDKLQLLKFSRFISLVENIYLATTLQVEDLTATQSELKTSKHHGDPQQL